MEMDVEDMTEIIALPLPANCSDCLKLKDDQKKLTSHWRHHHGPNDITDEMIECRKLERCPGCQLPFQSVRAHADRKVCPLSTPLLNNQVREYCKVDGVSDYYVGTVIAEDEINCKIKYSDGEIFSFDRHKALKLRFDFITNTKSVCLGPLLSQNDCEDLDSLVSEDLSSRSTVSINSNTNVCLGPLLSQNDDSEELCHINTVSKHHSENDDSENNLGHHTGSINNNNIHNEHIHNENVYVNANDYAAFVQGSSEEEHSISIDDDEVFDEFDERIDLPAFEVMSTANFNWGKTNQSIADVFLNIYNRMPGFRKNLFTIPSGRSGKAFIKEKSKLFMCWVTHNELERIALKAVAVMDFLLLQKTHSKAKAKDNKAALERRLSKWSEGDIQDLFDEVCAIQNHLNRKNRMDRAQLGSTFAKLIFTGQINKALRLLDQQASQGPQEISEEVLTSLKKLHPKGSYPDPRVLKPQSAFPQIEKIIFENITSESIKQASMRTNGSAGVSGADSDSWRRQLHSFGEASEKLAEAMALAAKRLCTSYVDPEGIEALIANRLVPLNKNPGTRPIGIGEVMRRIIGKAVMKEIRQEVADCIGVLNLSAGQKAGVEAIIHSMTHLFKQDETDAILLVDGTNAFNTLNRMVTLNNSRADCPTISIILINLYRKPARLFVQGGSDVIELSSSEGTTQGCPLAMSMYALGVLPLILFADCAGRGITPAFDSDSDSDESVPESEAHFVQAWFADDAQAGGCLSALKNWWDLLVRCGPAFGYTPQGRKSKLIVKPDKFEEAKILFKDTEIELTEGQRDLGAAIGSTKSVDQYIEGKVSIWIEQINLLSSIARTQPHAAYAAFTQGLQHRWSFLQRTMRMDWHLFHLEDAIRVNFIPSLFDDSRPISDVERGLYALPVRHGGLGISNPHQDALAKFKDSSLLSKDLQEKIIAHKRELDFDPSEYSAKIKKIKERWENRYENRRLAVCRDNLSLKRIVDFASEKGASNIFTTLPLEKYGFAIKAKRDFRDLLCLRYNTPVKNLPEKCVCGSNYSLDHSQICKRGGFIHIRHDQPKEAFAAEASKILRDVQCEPPLEALSGEVMGHKSAIISDDARSDVRVRGFWSNMRNAFFEFRVFYPHARSYVNQSPSTLYNKFEKDRKREYEQRIRDIEDGDFTPMIMSSTGGMGPQMSTALKHLASSIADKKNELYSDVVNVMRTKFAFTVARAALICLRGSRGRWRARVALDPMEDINIVSARVCL
jgi:hypothetical protein